MSRFCWCWCLCVLVLVLVAGGAGAQDSASPGLFSGSRDAGEGVQDPQSTVRAPAEKVFSGEKAKGRVLTIQEGDIDEAVMIATYSKTVSAGGPSAQAPLSMPDASQLTDPDPASVTLNYRVEQFSRFLIRSIMKDATKGSVASTTP